MPLASVTVTREPCICGLVTVMVTPGTGLPSTIAVPVRLPVVCAIAGMAMRRMRIERARRRENMEDLLGVFGLTPPQTDQRSTPRHSGSLPEHARELRLIRIDGERSAQR